MRLPGWLERLFHEPHDPEIDTIQRDLRTEKVRHSRELTRVEGAIADLGDAYAEAERERLRGA